MAVTNRQPQRGARLFEEVISSPNLVLLHLMNETSGALYDRGPWRYDATVSGVMTYSRPITAVYGAAFNGVNAYASMGDVTNLRFERTNSFSVMVMVDPNVSALGEILSKWNGVNAGWALGINATRTWRLVLQNTATTNVLEVRSTNALANNTDIMLLVTYAGGSAPGSVVMYENGAAVAMTTVTNNLSASIANAVAAIIGAQSDGTDLMSGDLGFLAVWNKVVSAEDARRYAFLAGML